MSTTDPLDLDAIEARASKATEGPWTHEPSKYIRQRYVTTQSESRTIWHATNEVFEPADAEFIAHSRTDVPALVARVRELEPRVLEGDWETVRDALDALPMGAQIRWTTGDPIHVALAIHRGVHWDATVYGGPLSSENIARDETPIEVIA